MSFCCTFAENGGFFECLVVHAWGEGVGEGSPLLILVAHKWTQHSWVRMVVHNMFGFAGSCNFLNFVACCGAKTTVEKQNQVKGWFSSAILQIPF